MSKKINLFFKGIVDVLPLLIPVVPFGVIVGAIGIELGFTPLETYATSLIIFGGASQICIFAIIFWRSIFDNNNIFNIRREFKTSIIWRKLK